MRNVKRRKTSPVWFLPSVEFKKLVATSKTYKEVLEKLGLSARGCNYTTLKTRITLEGISVDHFYRNFQSRVHNKTSKPLQDLLVLNTEDYISMYSLKKRLLKENLLKNICYICSQGPEWHGQPLTLQIDHINGNHRDNRLENLRILCPNCHTQTKTYTGRSSKKTWERVLTPIKLPNTVVCSGCGGPRYRKIKGVLCRACTNLASRKMDRPPLHELVEKIESCGYAPTSRLYKVSDNTLRKWLRAEGLNPKTIRKRQPVFGPVTK